MTHLFCLVYTFILAFWLSTYFTLLKSMIVRCCIPTEALQRQYTTDVWYENSRSKPVNPWIWQNWYNWSKRNPVKAEVDFIQIPGEYLSLSVCSINHVASDYAELRGPMDTRPCVASFHIWAFCVWIPLKTTIVLKANSNRTWLWGICVWLVACR